MNTTLAEIVSKIASQGSNPDVSFLKDNPEAQAMLLLALLSNTSNNKDNGSTNNSDKNEEGDKRKYDSIDDTPKKVGRKPVISEEDDSDDPKNKRKVQNRAAQRAFRERKENRVRLLEDKVKELEDLNSNKNSELQLENHKLKEMISQLQKENATLLGSSISFDYPLSTDELYRPQKIIKRVSSSLMSNEPSPVFDSHNSPDSTCSSSYSNKSRANTPEKSTTTAETKKDLSIDDILGLSTSELPSTTLLDHSELLGRGKDNSLELDSILQGHTFASDPSQFDFFYPLEAAIPSEHSNKKDNEGEMIVKDITKSWDQVSQHPRFDEFDMDVLCDEMHKKAVCGDVDHDTEMKKLIDQYYPITE